MAFFLSLVLFFFVASLAVAVFALVYAGKGKKRIAEEPSQFTGKGECNTAKTLGIIIIVLNVLFVIIAAFLLYIVAHIFQ